MEGAPKTEATEKFPCSLCYVMIEGPSDCFLCENGHKQCSACDAKKANKCGQCKCPTRRSDDDPTKEENGDDDPTCDTDAFENFYNMSEQLNTRCPFVTNDSLNTTTTYNESYNKVPTTSNVTASVFPMSSPSFFSTNFPKTTHAGNENSNSSLSEDDSMSMIKIVPRMRNDADPVEEVDQYGELSQYPKLIAQLNAQNSNLAECNKITYAAPRDFAQPFGNTQLNKQGASDADRHFDQFNKLLPQPFKMPHRVLKRAGISSFMSCTIQPMEPRNDGEYAPSNCETDDLDAVAAGNSKPNNEPETCVNEPPTTQSSTAAAEPPQATANVKTSDQQDEANPTSDKTGTDSQASLEELQQKLLQSQAEHSTANTLLQTVLQNMSKETTQSLLMRHEQQRQRLFEQQRLLQQQQFLEQQQQQTQNRYPSPQRRAPAIDSMTQARTQQQQPGQDKQQEEQKNELDSMEQNVKSQNVEETSSTTSPSSECMSQAPSNEGQNIAVSTVPILQASLCFEANLVTSKDSSLNLRIMSNNMGKAKANSSNKSSCSSTTNPTDSLTTSSHSSKLKNLDDLLNNHLEGYTLYQMVPQGENYKWPIDMELLQKLQQSPQQNIVALAKLDSDGCSRSTNSCCVGSNHVCVCTHCNQKLMSRTKKQQSTSTFTSAHMPASAKGTSSDSTKGTSSVSTKPTSSGTNSVNATQPLQNRRRDASYIVMHAADLMDAGGIPFKASLVKKQKKDDTQLDQRMERVLGTLQEEASAMQSALGTDTYVVCSPIDSNDQTTTADEEEDILLENIPSVYVAERERDKYGRVLLAIRAHYKPPAIMHIPIMDFFEQPVSLPPVQQFQFVAEFEEDDETAELYKKLNEDLKKAPAEAHEVIMDRAPLRCPDTKCDQSIFVSDFCQHLLCDHFTVPLERIEPRCCKTFFCDARFLRKGTSRCLMCFFIRGKIKNISNSEFKDYLPIMVMTSRVDMREICGFQARDTRKSHEHMIFWVTGLVPEKLPLACSLTIWQTAGSFPGGHYCMSNDVYPLRCSQQPQDVWQSGCGMLLHPKEIYRLSRACTEMINLQLVIH